MGENTEVRDAPDDLWIAGVYDTAQGLTFTYRNCLSLLALVKASAGVCVEIVFLVLWIWNKRDYYSFWFRAVKNISEIFF